MELYNKIEEMTNEIKHMKLKRKVIETKLYHPYWLILIVSLGFEPIVTLCIDYSIDKWYFDHEWFVGNKCIKCDTKNCTWKLIGNAIGKFIYSRNKNDKIMLNESFFCIKFTNKDDEKVLSYWEIDQVGYEAEEDGFYLCEFLNKESKYIDPRDYVNHSGSFKIPSGSIIEYDEELVRIYFDKEDISSWIPELKKKLTKCKKRKVYD